MEAAVTGATPIVNGTVGILALLCTTDATNCLATSTQSVPQLTATIPMEATLGVSVLME